MTSAARLAALTDAFHAARSAAAAADTGPGGDSGTCNFDEATIFGPGLREETVQRAAAAAGVRVTRFEWFGKAAYWVCVTEGQANRRTRMAEAARRAMELFLSPVGITATMYYQVD